MRALNAGTSVLSEQFPRTAGQGGDDVRVVDREDQVGVDAKLPLNIC